MKVSVIGTPRCGRTVFLGLLYETLVRLSAAEDGGATEVILNTGPVQAKAFGDLRLGLMSGKWPSQVAKAKVSGSVLELGFRKRPFWPFSSGDLRTIGLQDIPLGKKDIMVMRSSGQLREAVHGSPGGRLDRYGLSERFRDSLDGGAFILLADASAESIEGGWTRGERDAFLATLVDDISMASSGTGRKLRFLIMLTKADRAGADAEAMLKGTCPRTSGSLRKAVSEKGASSNAFASWMGTEKGAGGEEVPATQVREGQVQIEYSQKEYQRLIGLLGKIAASNR